MAILRRLEEIKPIFAMVAIQIIYAGVALSAEIAFTHGVSPMIFVVYRQALATVALALVTIFAMKRGRVFRMALDAKGFSLVFFTAFVGVMLTQILYYQGIRYSSASFASAFINIIPAITFVMAASTGSEKVLLSSPRTKAKIMGTIICIGGAASIIIFQNQTVNETEPRNDGVLGCVFLFSSCCCWSLWLILQVPISKNYLDPLSQSSWICFLVTLQSALFTFFFEPDLKSWKLNSTFEILCCLYAGVMGSAVTVYLQSWCIERKGPVFSAMFNPLSTVFVTLIAFPLLHERLHFGSLVGAIVVVIGLYVILWGKAKDFDEDSIVSGSCVREENSFATNIEELLL